MCKQILQYTHLFSCTWAQTPSNTGCTLVISTHLAASLHGSTLSVSSITWVCWSAAAGSRQSKCDRAMHWHTYSTCTEPDHKAHCQLQDRGTLLNPCRGASSPTIIESLYCYSSHSGSIPLFSRKLINPKPVSAVCAFLQSMQTHSVV